MSYEQREGAKTKNFQHMRMKPVFAPEVHLKTRRKRLFDVKSLKVERSVGYQCLQKKNLAFVGKNAILYAAGCFLIVRDCLKETQKIFHSVFARGVTAIAVHPSMKYFAVGERADSFTIFMYSYPEVQPRKLLSRVEFTNPCSLVQFHPDGELLVALSDFPENVLTLWLWEEEKCLASVFASKRRIHDISFSSVLPDLFVTSGEREVSFWTVGNSDGSLTVDCVTQQTEDKDFPNVYQTLHLPNETFLSGSERGYLLFWVNPMTKDCLMGVMARKEEQPCHSGAIMGVFSAGDLVVTVGRDGWVNLWSYKIIARRIRMLGDSMQFQELETLDEIHVHDDAQLVHAVPAVASKQDASKRLWYAQDRSGSVWQIDISTSRVSNPPKQVVRGLGAQVSGMDNCKVYSLVAACSRNGYVMVYNCASKKEVCYQKFNAGASCISWPGPTVDPEGSSIITGFVDGTLRWLQLCRSEDGNSTELALRALQKPHSEEITCISFHKNGKTMVTASRDKTLFFNKVSNMELHPVAFFQITHDVEWIAWVKKRRKAELKKRRKPGSKTREKTDSKKKSKEPKLPESEDSSASETPKEKDDRVASRKKKDKEDKPPVSSEPVKFEYADLDEAFPEDTDTLSVKLEESEKYVVESEPLSESSETSSSSSSSYEEETPEPDKQKLVTRKAKGDKEKETSEDKEVKGEGSEQPSETNEPDEKQVTLTLEYDSLLMGCEKKYIFETEPPQPKYYSTSPYERRTFLIEYKGYQEYRLGQMKSYYDLADRVYDSEDEEHPNRSTLVKQYFKDLKYAQKKAARRKRRRELGLGSTSSAPEILGWLPSDVDGRLWLSLSEPDYGYLFEFAFERRRDGKPVDLVPTRALELLTSEITPVLSMSMSPCGEFIFLGQQDGQISACRLDVKFDISTGYDFVKYPLHDKVTGPITQVVMTSDGMYLVTAGADGNMFLLRFNVLQYMHGRAEDNVPLALDTPCVEDRNGCDMLTEEEELDKLIEAETMDKVRTVLEYLNFYMPELKEFYEVLKEGYDQFVDAAKNRLEQVVTAKKPLELGIDEIAAHPYAVARFNRNTEKLIKKVISKYDKQIRSWVEYYATIMSLRQNSLAYDRTAVTNPITGETIFTYLLENIPPRWYRGDTKYNPDIYEYEEHKPTRYEFFKNTKVLSKLHAALKKATESLISYPKDMPQTPAILRYNERKQENILRIKQWIHFEESNPTPKHMMEDAFYREAKKKIEEEVYAMKSTGKKKRFLPKNMKYRPSHKKEEICVFLNKMYRQCEIFNKELMKINAQRVCVEKDYTPLNKENHTVRDDVTDTLETLVNVVCVTETLIDVVVDNSEMSLEDAIDSPEDEHANLTATESQLSQQKLPIIPIIQARPIDESNELFLGEFNDDLSFYTKNPTPDKYEPLSFVEPFEGAVAPSFFEKEKHVTKSTTRKTTTRSESSSELSSKFINKLYSPTDSDGVPEATDDKYKIKSYIIDNKVIYTALMNTKPVQKQSLTEDYYFSSCCPSEPKKTVPVTYPRLSKDEKQMSTSQSGADQLGDSEQDLLNNKLRGSVMVECKDVPIPVPIHEEDPNYSDTMRKMYSRVSVCVDFEDEQRCFESLIRYPKQQSVERTSYAYSEYRDCFVGIKRQLDMEAQILQQNEKFKNDQRESDRKKFFDTIHRVQTILKREADCEKVYHDLVYNKKCRELNLIEQHADHMQSCHDTIKEQEKVIKFECLKLELLKLVSKHSQEQLDRLAMNYELLYEKFVSKLGSGNKHEHFYKELLKSTDEAKKEPVQVTPDESERNSDDEESSEDEEEGESETESEAVAKGKDSNGEKAKRKRGEKGLDRDSVPEKEKDEKEDSKTRKKKHEAKKERYGLDDIRIEAMARTLNVTPELFKEAKKCREERHIIQMQMAFHRRRIARCKNKYAFIMKKTQKSRGIVSTAVSEIDDIFSSIKQKLDEQKSAVVLSTRRIECRSVPTKPKENLSGLAQDVILQVDYVETIVNAVVTSVERVVVAEEMRKLKQSAKIAVASYTVSREKTKLVEPKREVQLKDRVDSTVKSVKSKTIVPVGQTHVKHHATRYDGCHPEPEDPVNLDEIIKASVGDYIDYSNLLEGDYFAAPDYFAYPVRLANHDDVVAYNNIRECLNDVVDTVEQIMNKSLRTAVRDLLGNIVHDVVMAIEAEIVASGTSFGTEMSEEFPTNPGGGLIYDMYVLVDMEKKDPTKYKYSQLYKRYDQEEEIEAPKKEGMSFVEIREEEIGEKDFAGLTDDYVVMSKGNIERLKNTQKILEDSFNATISKRKKEAAYLSKLKRLNEWLERVALKNIRFKIKDTMIDKFGRVLDLEALLDSIDNPHSHVARHITEKTLRVLRRAVKVRQKLMAEHRKHKRELVILNHRLWITFDKLKTEYDFWIKINRNKKKVLPRICATQGP